MRGSEGVMSLLIHQMRPTVFVGASRVQEHLVECRAHFFQFGLCLRRGQATLQNTLNLLLKSLDADVKCLHHYADGEGLIKCRPVDGHIAEVVEPLAHVHSAQGVLQHRLVFVGAVRVVRGDALDDDMVAAVRSRSLQRFASLLLAPAQDALLSDIGRVWRAGIGLP